MSRILVLHAYNAHNFGDGLLVEETIKLIKESFGKKSIITVVASHPDSFDLPGVNFISAMPTRFGYKKILLQTLLGIRRFDFVLGVGGGYLRGGSIQELLKTLLVHGPQLLASALTSRPVVYLPQSVGPFKYGTAPIVRALLGRLSLIYFRDDISFNQFSVKNARRGNDLALGGIKPMVDRPVNTVPILSVRSVRGKAPGRVFSFAKALGNFDAYVQSRTSGNDDRGITSKLNYRELLPILPHPTSAQSEVRVVVAVRLHAALMALQAGHYVVHLAYERKGYGAFSDLGLHEYVHNVNSFNEERVLTQLQKLLSDAAEREKYRAAVNESTTCLAGFRESLSNDIKYLQSS